MTGLCVSLKLYIYVFFCLSTVRCQTTVQAKERFVEADSLRDRSNSQRVRGAVGGLQLLVRHWFIPEDVTPDYYHFTFWRMFQRFVAGTINVFGTQVGLRWLARTNHRLGSIR